MQAYIYLTLTRPVPVDTIVTPSRSSTFTETFKDDGNVLRKNDLVETRLGLPADAR